MTDRAQTQSDSLPEIRVWKAFCPFRKDGAPVLGNFGASVQGVVIIEGPEWKKLLERVPDLGDMRFDVGELI